MFAGLDFGTSNSSIGVWESKSQTPSLLPLENGSFILPSALYTSRPNISVEEIDLLELKKRVTEAKRKQSIELKRAEDEKRKIKIFSDDEIENIERGILRRENAERTRDRYERQTIRQALYSDTETFYGETAIRSHLESPQSGYFIKSPKSFIGADIKHDHIELFSEVITRMIAFIKASAEKSIQKEIQNIVLGRPVNFHGSRGEKGNKQAINILERAAIAAGFKQVEFILEPIAAALDYERAISQDLIVLVLDAGGGTTDCSMVKLGPSYIHSLERESTVLGYAGDRIGGTDLDIKLAFSKIMPNFGKNVMMSNGLPIPYTLFWNAVAVNDVNARQQFLSVNTQREIALYLTKVSDKKGMQRLQKLQKERLINRLNRSAELAKIHLSDRDPIQLPLRYIEPELVVPISRNDFRESIHHELGVFLSLMKEVEFQAGTKPDVVYVTGGTAKSPVVDEWIRKHYPNTEIVVGDSFGSVTGGLTTWANRIYR